MTCPKSLEVLVLLLRCASAVAHMSFTFNSSTHSFYFLSFSSTVSFCYLELKSVVLYLPPLLSLSLSLSLFACRYVSCVSACLCVCVSLCVYRMQGNGTIWTPEEARVFEERLYEVDQKTPDRWAQIASGMLKHQYP